jgi:hypothetical protein
LTSGRPASFTAYAYNDDRVKSETSPPLAYEFTNPPTQAKRRAYLISVGINANQSNWNLDFAVKSVQEIRQTFYQRLSAEYEVVDVELISDRAPGSPRVSVKEATKANIHAVLDILSGRPVSPGRLGAIARADELRAATPDDLVVLYVSSHGYADPQGNFYVVPYDTGSLNGITEPVLNSCLSHPADQSPQCADARKFLERSISSDDLTEWWRHVDAGEMVMVLDSCHSAAVPGREFRPGPLGDRGFGQMAYDKRMRILTATQPDKMAWATGREGINRSLLSDALVTALNVHPQMSLAELLKEAERTVPERYKSVFPGVKEENIQYPLLLDFSEKSVAARQIGRDGRVSTRD